MLSLGVLFFQVNINTIEITVHTSCYCVLDLLCVTSTRIVMEEGRKSDVKGHLLQL